MKRWAAAPDLFEPEPKITEALNLVYLAKWAGVPPWELAKQSIYWFDVLALAAEVEQIRARENYFNQK